jgi:hypothetical protein
VRKFFIEQLVKEIPSDVDETLQWWVDTRGAHVASWLVGTRRLSLHMSGGVEYRIPVKSVTPAWFRVGFEKLRQSRRWDAQVEHGVVERVYKIKWLQWRKFSREEPN